MARTQDVLVIGGGIIGLSIARRLARDGLSVTLLERDRVGRGASWAAPGVLAAAAWHRKDPLVQLQRETLRMFPRSCEAIAAESGIDPEYQNCGGMTLLLDDQQVRMARSEVEPAKAHPDFHGQPPIQILTPDEARRREPNLATDILGVRLDTFTSQVRNNRLLEGLAVAARRAGARITEECEVSQLRRNGSQIIGVTTNHGDFDAATTILAAGAWSSQFDEALSRTMPTYPVRGQVVLLHAAPGLIRHIVKHRKCYIVPRRDGHLLIGSTEEHDAGFDASTTDEGVASLRTQARRLVPTIGDARFVRAWAGLRPAAPDHKAYIGPVPGFEGLLAATAHYRTGIAFAPLTAEIVAELVDHGRSTRDISIFEPGRPQLV